MHFNIRKRISLIILSLSMAMAMLPNVAFASSEESAYATSIIYYENINNLLSKWREVVGTLYILFSPFCYFLYPLPILNYEF